MEQTYYRKMYLHHSKDNQIISSGKDLIDCAQKYIEKQIRKNNEGKLIKAIHTIEEK